MKSAPSPLRIRPLMAEDIPAAAALYRRAYEVPCYGGAWDQRTSERVIRDVLRLFPDQCFVGERDGILHGFILCSSLAGIRATIEEFAVAPEAQDQGVGSALLDHVLALYRKRGVSLIELVANREAPAYEFYRNRGFHENEAYRLMGREL